MTLDTLRWINKEPSKSVSCLEEPLNQVALETRIPQIPSQKGSSIFATNIGETHFFFFGPIPSQESSPMCFFSQRHRPIWQILPGGQMDFMSPENSWPVSGAPTSTWAARACGAFGWVREGREEPEDCFFGSNKNAWQRCSIGKRSHMKWGNRNAWLPSSESKLAGFCTIQRGCIPSGQWFKV